MGNFFKILILLFLSFFFFNICYCQSSDTTYQSVASPAILKILIPGTPPFLTLQASFHYNNGLMDLAANDNTSFREDDFISGRNFGTRYGYGVSLTGKYSLQKEGYARL